MKKICLLFTLLFAKNTFSQTIINRDPEISQMMNEISKDSLQLYINTMVAFGTRSTLSTQSNPDRGIGAARNWVLKTFNEFGKIASGRLSAYIETTTIFPNGKDRKSTRLNSSHLGISYAVF